MSDATLQQVAAKIRKLDRIRDSLRGVDHPDLDKAAEHIIDAIRMIESFIETQP